MQFIRHIIVMLTISVLCISATNIAHAKTSQETLHSVEKKLQQNQEIIQNKEKEKRSVSQDIVKIQQEWQSLQTIITNNQKELTNLEEKINATNKAIEKKREEIVKLEDQVLSRENIIKKRLVNLQENDRANFIIETLLNSESIGDLINRISAVSTLLNADNQIIINQQADLDQIEKDKAEIAKQEESLKNDKKSLSDSQAKLQATLQNKETTIEELQSKYKSIENNITQARQGNESIQSQMNDIKDKIKKEKEALQAKVVHVESATNETAPSEQNGTAVAGKELYVTATAYSHEDTKSNITALGYNIKENPNMKLIAVDPNVIPLGKKVWVEGYGTAIAGDTGGAINGHIIDVLMPSKAAALSWGRKTVKIIILD